MRTSCQSRRSQKSVFRTFSAVLVWHRCDMGAENAPQTRTRSRVAYLRGEYTGARPGAEPRTVARASPAL
jgi:hypothetical protein